MYALGLGLQALTAKAGKLEAVAPKPAPKQKKGYAERVPGALSPKNGGFSCMQPVCLSARLFVREGVASGEGQRRKGAEGLFQDKVHPEAASFAKEEALGQESACSRPQAQLPRGARLLVCIFLPCV